MEISIKQSGFTTPEKKPKKKHLGCFFILLLFILALGGLAFYFKDYLSIIPSLFSVTHNIVPRSKAEQSLVYTHNGSKYVNILLLGSDNDAKFNPDNVLTQTIIIISLNTQTNQVNMISIPRDSWVPIDNVNGGYGKIDQASGFGGLALARQTVEQDYGVHIDYYAWVGLQGFVKAVDSLGGVDIDVNHPVIDDLYPNDISGNNPYGAIRLYIPAGVQHLDGIRALEYVRSRHGDLQGDFGRSARQQQVLLALKGKIENTNIVPQIPKLASDLQSSLRTDMSPTDIARLAPFLSHIGAGNVHTYILSPSEYGTNGMSPDGTQDIVKPDFAKITTLFNQLFQ